MSRRALAVLVCALALLPALLLASPARAQSCDPAQASCRGMQKLAERIAAECRRSGVAADAQCYAGIGTRVIREEIDAYQASPTHRALDLQRRLGDSVPLANATWLGTHNSFNAPSEPLTLSHTDSNQQLSLTDQLRLDMRSLELDLHWFAGRVVVCHGQGSVGCTTERTLAERLPELAAWVQAHPRDVLLLYLEDQIDDAAGYEVAAKTVNDALGKYLYRPRGGGCQNLPLDVTRRRILESGARVLVVGDCGQGSWQAISHAWPSSVRFESRPRVYKCDEPPVQEARQKIVRYFEDSTFLSVAAAPTGATGADTGLTPTVVRAMVRCGVDHYGFDQLVPGDGRLGALVWTWAEGQPDAAAGKCVVVARGDGRWSRRGCKARHRAACANAEATEWRVTATAARRLRAAKACAKLGLRFATPRTGAQNAALQDAIPAGVDSVWIRHLGG